ncbi:DUF2167 domain-containing protein [Pandoraea bronchicola]|uniref:DUF2167 domain-containing protein n=1 Tax=Pandoraea bronchicola TaxID=2508287 RepID=A0A5E5BPN2_9BURK|nr:DUF2167 domain-containing protein [Pandoraea bronchicola]VVE87614.1 hypothetical protein PBR20603_01551 [Pandoraea bronchicola]
MSSILRTLLLALALNASGAFAQTPAPAPVAAATPEAREAEARAAFKAANEALIEGPKNIDIRDQAKFSLPSGMGWIPGATAARLLRALGNTIDETTLAGLVVPTDGKGEWLDVIAYVNDGYVRDDDARDWKADDILESLRKSTESANATRREHGVPELEVTGWAQLPQYDSSTHRLVWAARVGHKQTGIRVDDDPSVNYRTTALGRDGYLATTLVTSESLLAADKPVADKILAGLTFVDGKRYADFNEKTDRVAEYGLAALVAGVAAKKLGLFALIAAFVAKFAKVGLLALLGAGAAFGKLFKRKPKPLPVPPQATPSAGVGTPETAVVPVPDVHAATAVVSQSAGASTPHDGNAPRV